MLRHWPAPCWVRPFWLFQPIWAGFLLVAALLPVLTAIPNFREKDEIALEDL